MSDLKFTLPGTETVTLTSHTIEKLIRAGDGDAALLYLYILKTHGQSSQASTEAEMGKSPGWIASAMAVLSRLGLVRIEDKADAGTPDTETPGVPAPRSKPPLAAPEGPVKTHPEEMTGDPLEAPRRYTIEEIKLELQAGSVFASIVEETQRSLGKIITPDELLRLFGIYDSLRMPPEVILQLITHCISECRLSGGRPPSLRYIEKAAYTWEREGINTLDKAEEHIKELEARRSKYGEIKSILQIKGREFSPTEKRYVDSWIVMGFDMSVIAIACDKTLVKTGKMVWGYMDTILKNWHKKGIHTAEEVAARDTKADDRALELIKGKTNKFDAPNNADLERMQRLLSKIKEE